MSTEPHPIPSQEGPSAEVRELAMRISGLPPLQWTLPLYGRAKEIAEAIAAHTAAAVEKARKEWTANYTSSANGGAEIMVSETYAAFAEGIKDCQEGRTMPLDEALSGESETARLTRLLAEREKELDNAKEDRAAWMDLAERNAREFEMARAQLADLQRSNGELRERKEWWIKNAEDIAKERGELFRAGERVTKMLSFVSDAPLNEWPTDSEITSVILAWDAAAQPIRDMIATPPPSAGASGKGAATV